MVPRFLFRRYQMTTSPRLNNARLKPKVSSSRALCSLRTISAYSISKPFPLLRKISYKVHFFTTPNLENRNPTTQTRIPTSSTKTISHHIHPTTSPITTNPDMLLRVRGPDGTFRITLDQGDTFGTLGKKVSRS